MLNQEINQFCFSWLEKSKEIDDRNLQGLFDKFFTLYVVYNRLYVESTYRLSNANKIKLGNTFPDRKAAIYYVVEFLTSRKIQDEFQKDVKCQSAIEILKKIIRENIFNIKLHLVSAIPQPEKDIELLKKLESDNLNTKITGITEFIYSIRCNIFHAQKGYNERQNIVLKPVNILLEKIIEILFDELNRV